MTDTTANRAGPGTETVPDAHSEPGTGTGTGRSWRIPPEEGALARARALARDCLRDWGYPAEEYAHAVLLVSELVTNVHRHAGGPAELELRPEPGGITVLVGDSSPCPPVRREPGADGGFGMHLLARLSLAWGVRTFPGGKSVWARLAARPGS
ncbi:ATP-binding protein [Kitasatospora sp. NPDC057015]|uniref:ATP-binding protein n=1 Tax=Kitasatospora sp. NPDC057015 TaxID=3346001 RepID=UPI003645AAE9